MHGYSGAIDVVDKRIADSLQCFAGEQASSTLSEEEYRTLVERGYLTEKTPEEETAWVTRVAAMVEKRAKGSSFVIIPTYDCNLRCTYCYQKLLRSKGRPWLEQTMDREMVDAAFRAMDRLAEHVKGPVPLTLYGGEPLLPRNREIIEYIVTLAVAREYKIEAITNGTCLEVFLDLLGPGKISHVQVTLDGPPEAHDRRRFLPDGQGTCEQIVRNLDHVLGIGLPVTLRVNVDQENAAALSSLNELFVNCGWLNYPHFRAYDTPTDHWVSAGHCEDFTVAQLMRYGQQTLGDSPTGQMFERAFQSRATMGLITALQTRKPPAPEVFFCGANAGMYVFDPFGDLYSCWEDVGRGEQHTLGRYFPDLALKPEPPDKRWGRSVLHISECIQCSYVFFCKGGCKSRAYRAHGNYTSPDCADFPTLFQMLARLAYTTSPQAAPVSLPGQDVDEARGRE